MSPKTKRFQPFRAKKVVQWLYEGCTLSGNRTQFAINLIDRKCCIVARRSNGEGTVAQQRKNGSWYRAVRIEGTNQRKFLYGKTKAEVDKKYKEFIKQVAGGADNVLSYPDTFD